MVNINDEDEEQFKESYDDEEEANSRSIKGKKHPQKNKQKIIKNILAYLFGNPN